MADRSAHLLAVAVTGTGMLLAGCSELGAPVVTSMEAPFTGGVGVDGTVEYTAKSMAPAVVSGVDLIFHVRGDYEVTVLEGVPGTEPLRKSFSVGDVQLPARLSIEADELTRFDRGGMIFISTVVDGTPRSGFIYY